MKIHSYTAKLWYVNIQKYQKTRACIFHLFAYSIPRVIIYKISC